MLSPVPSDARCPDADHVKVYAIDRNFTFARDDISVTDEDQLRLGVVSTF